MKDIISKRTRNKFREELVGWTLREIETEFDNEGFKADKNYEPPMSGMRRGLVEQIYQNIRFYDSEHVKRILNIYNEVIRVTKNRDHEAAEKLKDAIIQDGIDLDENGRWAVPVIHSNLNDLISVSDNLDASELETLIKRVTNANAINEDPSLAIGTAKEIVESICKTILSESDPSLNTKSIDFPKLVKATFQSLELLPENIPDQAKGADAMKRLLSGLNGAVGGLGELRNLYGSGHGRDGRRTGLTPRHARLTVGMATTLAMFLYETHVERANKNIR